MSFPFDLPFDPTVISGLRYNEQGLIPAIAQDYLDGTVLMLAWMNQAALEKTLETGQAWYWSRSREELWHKGATSGHFQNVKHLRYDCDSDALLLSIEQVGDVACHTGARSCFYQDVQPTPLTLPPLTPATSPPADALSELFKVICDRRDHPQPDSYTCKLFAGGDNKILKKIGEESAEVVMACKDNEPDHIAEEAADLMYHLLVALSYHQVDLRMVYRKLYDRRR